MIRIFGKAGSGLLRSPAAAAALLNANPGKFNSSNKFIHLANEGLFSNVTPKTVVCEKGKTVWWCACGHSAKQPLCDGSHKTKGQGKTPFAFTPPEAKEYLMCTCKQTKKVPLCDGSQGGCRSFA